MPKRLVICCDGTWNKPDQQSPSNVTKAALAVSAVGANGVQQLVYYDKGVGTGRFDHLGGGAFGWGLSDNIKQAYRFLLENYAPGDELFFFGFSRGAYTVRSLAGLIRNSGLLKSPFTFKLDEAYALYRRRDSASHPSAVESQLFRKSFSWEPRVKFIGVWDTVGSLGIPVEGLLGIFNRPWRFHDVQLSRSVENAFQALAIDEHRSAFQPAIWVQHPEAYGQVLEQVWFAGAHSNVGGGYPDSGLSDIALSWMIRKAQNCGLAFDSDWLRSMTHENPEGQIVNSQNLFFFLMGGGNYTRPIPKEPGQFVASTAAGRMKSAAKDYHPENLQKYLKGGGPVANVP